MNDTERTILRYIAAGWPTKWIATRTQYAPQTVRHYTQSLLEIAGVSNRTQLALWALREKHTTLDEAWRTLCEGEQTLGGRIQAGFERSDGE